MKKIFYIFMTIVLMTVSVQTYAEESSSTASTTSQTTESTTSSSVTETPGTENVETVADDGSDEFDEGEDDYDLDEDNEPVGDDGSDEFNEGEDYDDLNEDNDEPIDDDDNTSDPKDSTNTDTNKTQELKQNAAKIRTTYKPAELAEKQKAYDDARAKEQSMANKALTAATTAATGIGGMELAMGLAQQKADKNAAADMDAYIATMRCSYADGKSVKFGPEEITLPGGNDQTMMNYRGEYFSLAQKLKDTKESMGIKPGIESEIIMDNAQMGLYDDENVGITDGNYASLYRASALKSESDQEKIDADKDSAKKRVIAGAVVGGVGVAGGVLGNSLINGKLGDKIKELKDKTKSSKENNETIRALKQGLKDAGMTNVDKLDLSKFDLTEIKDMFDRTDFTKLDLSAQDASKLINTANQKSLTSSLESLFKTEQ